ncbi:transcriptional regulator [bacterium]|nr:transcriptional regulator [bacterium]
MQKKDYDKTLTRLIHILTKLSNDERPNSKDLAEEFGVTMRTIQNDINRLVTSYPITKDSDGKFMFEYGYSLKRTSLNSDEMIFLTLALSQFEDVSDIDKIKDSIYKKIVNQNLYNPYFIKYDHLEDLDVDSPRIASLENYIKSQEIVKIDFTDKTTELEVYKIAAFYGFWYLFAKDLSDAKTKTFKLSKIKKITPLGKYHKTPHAKIDAILEKTYSAFYDDGNSFEVIIKVDKEVAAFFKSREFLQSQKIKKELPDGSLEVSFEISHDEDVDNIIKAWLPHVEILEPKRFRDKLTNELEDYLKRVKK